MVDNKRKPIVVLALCFLISSLLITCSSCSSTDKRDDYDSANAMEHPVKVDEISQLDEIEDRNATGLFARQQSSRALDLSADVEALINESGVSAGAVYINLRDPADYFSINGETPFVGASIIKLIVLAEVFRSIDEGAHSFTEPIAIDKDAIVGGTGMLQYMDSGNGIECSLEDLCSYMISESDNTAANALIDLVGMESINRCAAVMGLTNTSMNRKMLDYEAMSKGAENITCANDTAMVLWLICENEFINEEMSARAFDMLRNQHINGGIENGLPADVEVAHKTGTLENVENDAAIIGGDHPYILVILTSGDHSEALALTSQISSMVWSHVNLIE